MRAGFAAHGGVQHVVGLHAEVGIGIADQARQRLNVLTDKEREVVVLVGGGLSNSEIAKNLLMSEGTAKAHVSRILTKLDCTNRVQAAILAHDAGLLPPT